MTLLPRLFTLALALLVAGLAATPAPAVEKRAVLIMAANQDMPNIDPAVTPMSVYTASALIALYDPLLMYRGDKMLPHLATSVTPSADATEWTIKLNPAAKFQDGSPVNAEAVKYTFERVLKIKKGPAWMWLPIMDDKSLTVVDDQTLRVKLTKPFSLFDRTLPNLLVVNPKVVKANDKGGDDGQAWLVNNSAGSGPFKVNPENWRNGAQYEFIADPQYWKGWPKEGKLDGYVWKVVRESSAQKLALIKGEVHGAQNISPDDIAELQKTPGVRVDQYTGVSPHRIVMHHGHTSKYLADPNVRKALAYAYDYSAVPKIYAGHAEASKGPVAPPLPGFADKLPLYTYDIDKAKAFLAKSPWPNGGFTLDYIYPAGYDVAKNLGAIMLAGAQKLNIKVTLTPMVWANVLSMRTKSETMPQMISLWLAPLYFDADAQLYSQWHSESFGRGNYSFYKNPKVDELLDRARRLNDPKARAALQAEAQKLIVEDSVDIFTAIEKATYVWRNDVKGYTHTPLRERNPLFAEMWLATQ
jgi:peptide/nickel transport system substrate-binding protein